MDSNWAWDDTWVDDEEEYFENDQYYGIVAPNVDVHSYDFVFKLDKNLVPSSVYKWIEVSEKSFILELACDDFEKERRPEHLRIHPEPPPRCSPAKIKPPLMGTGTSASSTAPTTDSPKLSTCSPDTPPLHEKCPGQLVRTPAILTVRSCTCTTAPLAGPMNTNQLQQLKKKMHDLKLKQEAAKAKVPEIVKADVSTVTSTDADHSRPTSCKDGTVSSDGSVQAVLPKDTPTVLLPPLLPERKKKDGLRQARAFRSSSDDVLIVNPVVDLSSPHCHSVPVAALQPDVPYGAKWGGCERRGDNEKEKTSVLAKSLNVGKSAIAGKPILAKSQNTSGKTPVVTISQNVVGKTLPGRTDSVDKKSSSSCSSENEDKSDKESNESETSSSSSHKTSKDLRCPNNHRLKSFTTPDARWFCSGCSKGFKKRVKMYGCKPCEYDLCTRCSKRRSKRSHSNGASKRSKRDKTSKRDSGRRHKEKKEKKRKRKEREKRHGVKKSSEKDETRSERKKEKERERKREREEKRAEERKREEEKQREDKRQKRQESQRQEGEEKENLRQKLEESPAGRITLRGRGAVHFYRSPDSANSHSSGVDMRPRNPLDARPSILTANKRVREPSAERSSERSPRRRRKEPATITPRERGRKCEMIRKGGLFGQFRQIIRAAGKQNSTPLKTEENTRRLCVSRLRSNYKS